MYAIAAETMVTWKESLQPRVAFILLLSLAAGGWWEMEFILRVGSKESWSGVWCMGMGPRTC